MSTKPIDITGGESVYCFNEGQLKNAYKLVMEDSESSARLRPLLEELAENYSRNEQAALAFVLIDRLRGDPQP